MACSHSETQPASLAALPLKAGGHGQCTLGHCPGGNASLDSCEPFTTLSPVNTQPLPQPCSHTDSSWAHPEGYAAPPGRGGAASSCTETQNGPWTPPAGLFSMARAPGKDMGHTKHRSRGQPGPRVYSIRAEATHGTALPSPAWLAAGLCFWVCICE